MQPCFEGGESRSEIYEGVERAWCALRTEAPNLVKRIAAITFIFACTTVAWMILGSTIFARSYDRIDRLENSVGSTWGTAQVQKPPVASYTVVTKNKVTVQENGKLVT